LGEPALALLASEKTYNGILFQFIKPSYPCPLLFLKATIRHDSTPKRKKIKPNRSLFISLVNIKLLNYIYMGTKLGPLGLCVETSDLPLGTQCGKHLTNKKGEF